MSELRDHTEGGLWAFIAILAFAVMWAGGAIVYAIYVVYWFV